MNEQSWLPRLSDRLKIAAGRRGHSASFLFGLGAFGCWKAASLLPIPDAFADPSMGGALIGYLLLLADQQRALRPFLASACLLIMGLFLGVLFTVAVALPFVPLPSSLLAFAALLWLCSFLLLAMVLIGSATWSVVRWLRSTLASYAAVMSRLPALP